MHTNKISPSLYQENVQFWNNNSKRCTTEYTLPLSLTLNSTSIQHAFVEIGESSFPVSRSRSSVHMRMCARARAACLYVCGGNLRVSRAMSYLFHQMPHAPPAGSWSRTRGVAIPSLSLSHPSTTEWACIGVPTSRVSSPTTPPSLFPPGGPGATPRPWDPTRTDAATVGQEKGKRTVEPFSCRFESPLLCRVVRARCPLGCRDPRLPFPPIGSICPQSSGDTRLSPSFSRNQLRCRRSPLVLLLRGTAESGRTRMSLGASVRGLISCHGAGRVRVLSLMRRKYRSVPWREYISILHIRAILFSAHRNVTSLNLGKINDQHLSYEICSHRLHYCYRYKSNYFYIQNTWIPIYPNPRVLFKYSLKCIITEKQ